MINKERELNKFPIRLPLVVSALALPLVVSALALPLVVSALALPLVVSALATSRNERSVKEEG